MATGNSTQLTRQVGEHLVAAELGRRGLYATPFAGNVPDFDLIVVNGEGKSTVIQVKAIRGPSWQFQADKFLIIEMSGNEQVVKGKKQLSNPALVCVFVLLGDAVNKNQDKFYIFRLDELQAEIAKTYKGGVRPKNHLSMHCAIWPKQLSCYMDKWELITNSMA